jgi:hypothetical protein
MLPAWAELWDVCNFSWWNILAMVTSEVVLVDACVVRSPWGGGGPDYLVVTARLQRDDDGTLAAAMLAEGLHTAPTDNSNAN